MNEIRIGSRALQPHRQLLAEGGRVALGKRALDILTVLAEARGAIVTKDELLEAVWPGVVVEEGAITVHLVALRKALGPDADRLQTIRGVGYRLAVDDGAGELPVLAPARTEALAQVVSQSNAFAGVRQGPLWPKALTHRLALALVGLLVVLGAAWTTLGDNLGLRSQERIPLVLHSLSATNTGDPVEAGFGRGITDELVMRLRRVPELRVATAASNGRVPGNDFGNAYIVDGTIRTNGNRVRVTARLIDPKGEVLWSEAFDRNLIDLFEVQDKIAAAIANELSVTFDVGANSTRYGGTDNPEAYAAYMQFWAHNVELDQSIPTRYLEQAARLDPHYGKVLYGLAYNYCNVALNSAPDEATRLLAKQDEVSAQALSTHPELWFGPMARAAFERCNGNFRAFDQHTRQAVLLDKGNDPELRAQLASNYIGLGRFRQGAAFRRSMEVVDPVYADDPWRVFILMFEGRYQESIDLYARLEREGDSGVAQLAYQAFFSRLLLGSEADALRFAEQRNLPYGDMLERFRSEKALQTMTDEELERSQERQFPNIIARTAHLAAYDGHPKLAIRLMRIAMERPSGIAMTQSLWHPAMAEARKTDEFEQLVTDIGLVQFWRESGDWGDYCRPVSAREIACR